MKSTNTPFNGVAMNLGNIMKLSSAVTRSITAENVYGEKGKGGMAKFASKPQPGVVKIGQLWDEDMHRKAAELGQGWKVRPCIKLPKASTTTIMDIDGPGVIQHIWMAFEVACYRDVILRIYWDNEETPSVEAPIGDFFCNSWKERSNVLSLPINVNPTGGLNCYFPMPFRKHVKVTVENRAPVELFPFFYTINYALTEVADDDAYFHAQFRRNNPLAYMTDHVILDGIRGQGQFVGTFMAWQQNCDGWWGEGEFKAFIDGDKEFPTICGTGTEDYFGGAWGFGKNYSAPYLGFQDITQATHTNHETNRVGHRHAMYRFHIMDPIRFSTDFKATMQALGWRSEWRYLPLQDDISSVAYWYQTEPHAPFPKLGTRDQLEII